MCVEVNGLKIQIDNQVLYIIKLYKPLSVIRLVCFVLIKFDEASVIHCLVVFAIASCYPSKTHTGKQ